ncbi:glycoside hydrolase family 27 protein [candidate division KSB1 bacterium]|nr:glycoside hydrolase family 27 protein [candidate division KSB1 bacterium]
MRRVILFIILCSVMSAFGQKFTGLALTPPMGWNSWNHFACDVNEAIIMETADAMVETGMKDAGYLYVNIDDCWHGKRDSLGFIHPDPERFPSGMKALSDYIHSKGLKMGIYSDAGWKTCGGRPGSRGYEYQDAMQYAKWGVDYLKYDWCNTEELNARGAYLTMCNALHKAGRPIVFSLCEWGNNDPWKWGKIVGHLWRTTGDIAVLFDGEVDHGGWSSWGVLQIMDMRKDIRQYAGPDHWNDPDMMEVGNGMSQAEDRAHFAMWCMLAAPLIAGNDLGKMSKETLEILTNEDAIAVDQDSLGIQAFKVLVIDSVDVWAKPLMNDELAVCFLNRAKSDRKIVFDWKTNPIKDTIFEKEFLFDVNEYKIRDLWKKKSRGSTKKTFKSEIASHDVIMLRLAKK